MAVAALVVSILAVAFTAFGLYYTHRATRLSEAADRRARVPVLTVIPEDGAEGATQVFYRLRNDGPQDLDSVVAFRPRPSDGLTYELRHVGGEWAADEVDLGRLPLTQEARFGFGCGPARPWPDFQLRVVVRHGRDEWTVVVPLPEPSRGLGVY